MQSSEKPFYNPLSRKQLSIQQKISIRISIPLPENVCQLKGGTMKIHPEERNVMYDEEKAAAAAA